MLLVYGPRSTTYDFGPGHPLTPRRFGPGIDLLRAVGAEPGLAPEPATDEELRWCHTGRYLELVKRFSYDPYGFAAVGIGEGGDCPPFAGMHEASAAVAGGSIRALEAILRGDVEHALHPGGGLHHAMPERASGFCIYDDPALAIARARRDGLRVLYLDFDVHHGDGVQAIHAADPGVLTCSFHETGRTLFPGTGDADEVGEGTGTGTSVNVPLPPGTGAGAWIAAVRSLVPELAATFGPDLIVSQHGADSHAWDPLAHLNITTSAMGEAATLVDRLAHEHADGRWLATGGGGYDAYRVVPRAWALTWLAGAHREVPTTTPAGWRDRWADEAARYGQTPLPATFTDPAGVGEADDPAIEHRVARTVALVRQAVIPRLVREARDRGWWDPLATTATTTAADPMPTTPTPGVGRPAVISIPDGATWSRLTLAPRVIAPADPAAAHAIVGAALRDGALVTGAVEGTTVVGLAIARHAGDAPRTDVLALGVAPGWRRMGLGGRLLEALVGRGRPGDTDHAAEVTLAERDVVEPLDRTTRVDIARRLLERAGFRVSPDTGEIRAIDPGALVGVRAVGPSDDRPGSGSAR